MERRVEFLVPAFLFVLVAAPFVIGSWVAATPPNLPLGRGGVEGWGLGEVAVAHVPLPTEVRGLYWTATTALSPRADELLVYMLERGLNTVVIDAKLDNGTAIQVSAFKPILETLANNHIYRIVRVAVMRDGALASSHPEIALRDTAGSPWKDKTGEVWVDPAALEVTGAAIATGRALYAAGFDEVQFDYVRFPSDGELGRIVYPVYRASESRVDVMQRFFDRVGSAMREDNIPVSFDVFGMTFWSLDDFEIGQRLVDANAYADFISPMVYPSHYPDGFEGFVNPAEYPYEIVKRSLDRGTQTVAAISTGSTASVSARWRPWLQDFDIGAVYTAQMIEEQIRAVRDAGASGWLLWNARNVYEPAEYK